MSSCRLPIATLCNVLLRLLLPYEDLLDPNWLPAVSFTEFVRKRLRPAAFFLQRAMCGPEGMAAPPPEISQGENTEITSFICHYVATLHALARVRHRVLRSLAEDGPSSFEFSNYTIPGRVTRAFEYALEFLARFPVEGREELLAADMIRPMVQGLLFVSRAVSLSEGSGLRDFLEYNSRGNLSEMSGGIVFPLI
ncbi:hypothetical protein DFH09DRAFT_1077677 [Mycena vulgaris]|nr:hypothetical protein DFH09DRAFT_1077677 [Mycena vulgaris]